MATQKASYLPEPKTELVIKERDIPEPGPGEVLVEVHSASLNPADWKIQAYGMLVNEFPTILGIDSAGIVKKVGAGVTNVAVGDKVLHQGARNVRNATFQQYTVAPAEIVAKVPPNLTLDQASTIPLAIIAAATGLYYGRGPEGLGFSPPWEEGGRGKHDGEPILVMGGSSALGQLVIQFAKLSGLSPIITTASPHNEAFLKSLGATHVVDRAAPLSDAVKAITDKPIKAAFDAVSFPETQNAAYDVLAPGGMLVLVLPSVIDERRRTPDKEVAMVLSVSFPPEKQQLRKSLYAHLTDLLEAGDIKPNNVEVLPGGLAGIPEGLKRLQKGVSALKLVVRPQETA